MNKRSEIEREADLEKNVLLTLKKDFTLPNIPGITSSRSKEQESLDIEETRLAKNLGLRKSLPILADQSKWKFRHSVRQPEKKEFAQ